MARYRKKPVEIDAWQYHGQLLANCNCPHWLFNEGAVSEVRENGKLALEITTLEGTMRAGIGDWIIKGIKGELYPCKPDIFEATYEAVG